MDGLGSDVCQWIHNWVQSIVVIDFIMIAKTEISQPSLSSSLDTFETIRLITIYLLDLVFVFIVTTGGTAL